LGKTVIKRRQIVQYNQMIEFECCFFSLGDVLGETVKKLEKNCII